MSKNTDFERLKLLDDAHKELENLEILKYQLQSLPIGSEKTKLDLILKKTASNLIDCYEELLSLYSRNFNHPNDNQFDDLSYRKSHSRSKVNTKSTKITEKEINQVITNSTLASSIAYIKTNFLEEFEESGIIYLKNKDYLSQLLQNIESEKHREGSREGRKSELSIFGEKIRKNHGKDDSESERSSISLSKFYDKPKSIKKHQDAEEIGESRNELHLSEIRICMNLMTNLILQNKHTFAMEIFTEMVDFIEKVNDDLSKRGLIEYIFMTWFNIESGSLRTWKDKLECFRKEKTMKITERMSVEEAISLSHFIFNSDLFSCEEEQSITETYPKHFIKILEKSVSVFLENSLYEFAFFTLRHLLQSPVSPELKETYYLQLREMLESGKLKEDIELQNIESVECFKEIISTLKGLHEETQSNISEDFALISSKKDLFIFVIKVQISKISSHSELPSEQKDFLIEKLSIMKNETRESIIDSMLNQSMAKKIIQDIFSKVQKIIEVTDRHLFIYSHYFLKNLKKNQNQKLEISPLTEKAMNVSSLEHDSSQIKSKIVSPCHSRRYLKVISTSILSDTSSIHYPSTSRKHNVSSSNLTTNSNDYKKISKMVRFCEYGAFLNKRNYNSDGGEIKFIQITYDKIKWSKNPEKINESSQSYPLKDIKAIFYGKITPNLKKSCNKQLKEELCFSLILQKRTMDFYCKDYKEVESWVCGLSVILKKQNPEITGYTPGKLRWRKMFANLREAFIEPLKLYERNQFYFENAYSLILFQKNGYKLPLCQKIL